MFEESQENNSCGMNMDDISSFSSWNETTDDSKAPTMSCQSCHLTVLSMKMEQKFADEFTNYNMENRSDNAEDHVDSDEEEHSFSIWTDLPNLFYYSLNATPTMNQYIWKLRDSFHVY